VVLPRQLFFNGVPDTAEGYGGDSQIRSDIMLRHPLDDMRPFPEEVEVTFFGGVPNIGFELVHIAELPFQEDVHQLFIRGRVVTELLHNGIHIFFMYPVKEAGFDRLDRVQTGNVFMEALDGGNALLFEEKLEGDLFPFVIEPSPHAALFDEISFFGDGSLP